MCEDATLKALQLEFDEILTCIKPLYLSWKNVQEKTSIAAWIRKLTNIKCSTVDTIHLRNLYILGLYDNLKKEIVMDPFNRLPPNGDLPALPSNLKQMIEKFALKTPNKPEWLKQYDNPKEIGLLDMSVDYEEDDYVDDLKFGDDSGKNGSQNNFVSCGEENHQWQNLISKGSVMFDEFYPDHQASLIGGNDFFNTLQLQKEDLGDSIGKTGFTDPYMLSKIQEREMEKRLVQLQNAYHGDIMKIRMQHDSEMQTLIHRKNAEIEELRKDYKEKLQEQDANVQQLESKANDCLKQLQVFQELKSKELDQMKRKHQDTINDQSSVFEQKVSNLYEDFQTEKQHLILEHKKEEERLKRETQEYFSKLKSDLTERSTNTDKEITILQKDITDLKSSKVALQLKNDQFELENQNLLMQLKKEQTDFQESHKKYLILDSQYNFLMNSHQEELKSVKDNYETALHKCERDKKEIDAESRDKITKLEKEVNELQAKVNEDCRNYFNELDNLKAANSCEKNRLTQSFNDEIETLKSQMKTYKNQTDLKICDLEKSLEAKEMEIMKLKRELEMKDKINSKLVDDLKQDMSISHERVLRKKEYEHEEVVNELQKDVQEKTKEVNDLMQQLAFQKQETEIKLTEIRKWSDSQVTSLTNDWKQEKFILEKEFQVRLSKVKEEHNEIVENLKREKDKKISEYLNKTDTVSRELSASKQELELNTQLYKKQINELIRMHDEEKFKIQEEHRSSLESISQQSLELKTNIEKKHSEHISQLLTKTNEKLKEIEEEYCSRSMQSFQIINDLKGTIEKLKEEKKELATSHETHVNNLIRKYNNEIENMQKSIQMNLETFSRELLGEQTKSKEWQNQLERKESDFKRKIFQAKLDYEMKLSKLLPIHVQKEYEETIQSLRNQISFFQQRITILEDEIGTVSLFKPYHHNKSFKLKSEKMIEE